MAPPELTYHHISVGANSLHIVEAGQDQSVIALAWRGANEGVCSLNRSL